MVSNFQNSIFHHILNAKQSSQNSLIAIMGGMSGSRFKESDAIDKLPFVVFDFETTGLDVKTSRIIEIGAIKYINQKEIERFSQLINPGIPITDEITKVTGIKNEMLVDQPDFQSILPKFHDFLRGCVGLAHNAEFDVGMLFHESNRLGISCDYTVFCSLKMARDLVKIERRNLDALAKHYGLSFESRHRSIGDILVTADVFWSMLRENPAIKTIGDLYPYREEMPG
ncbi:3'-5' exonuclease [Pigmentibacter sp. JX0631]|uniref:3'-5' exonuclease n=1 Tax=Pigmentibacter sp. JX0631 TaxID=2976982 RepID=UPI00246976D4|nr:3'-5' exonuclease [Pigmentibacter sp. JX0631]WGL59584.1 3'-5' exonuclease [Pigmentibacter sp. JX0631]